MYLRCGPNWSVIRSSSAGSVAMAGGLLLQVFHPRLRRFEGRALGNRQHRSPALRTDPLIVLGIRAGHLVAVAELLLDHDQILDVHPRRVRLLTSTAERLIRVLAHIAIERNAQLR